MNTTKSFFDSLSTTTTTDTTSQTTVNTKGEVVKVSTSNANVDLFLSGQNQTNIRELFNVAYKEDSKLAIKNLLYILDRKGKGQRFNFKKVYGELIQSNPNLAFEIAKLMGKYGRYDYLLERFASYGSDDYSKRVLELIRDQLLEDLKNFENNQSISLLAKWLPSHRAKKLKEEYLDNDDENYEEIDCDCEEHAGDPEWEDPNLIKIKKNVNNHHATYIYTNFARDPKISKYIYNQKTYRQTLTKLRKYLNVVESKLTKNEQINYNTLTSRNLSKYRKVLSTKEIYKESFANWLTEVKHVKSSNFDFPNLIYKTYEGKEMSDNEIQLLNKSFLDYVSKVGIKGKPLIILDDSGSMFNYMMTMWKAILTTFSILHVTKQREFCLFSRTLRKATYNNSLSFYENVSKLQLEQSGTNFENVVDHLLKNKKQVEKQFDAIVVLSDQEYDESENDVEKTKWVQFIDAFSIPIKYISYQTNNYFTHYTSKDKVSVISGGQQIINDILKHGTDFKDYVDVVLSKYDGDVDGIFERLIENENTKRKLK